MATVYFVREGSGDERTTEGRTIPLSKIESTFLNSKVVWSPSTPVFNREISRKLGSPYRFVVLYVEGGETAGKFVKDGYWTLVGVSPEQFNRKIPDS